MHFAVLIGFSWYSEQGHPGCVEMDVSKNGGTQQPWVFLLKIIILGCFGGTIILGNTQIGLEDLSTCSIFFYHII